MDKEKRRQLIVQTIPLAEAAAEVLSQSMARAKPILESKKDSLTHGESETLEALTSRFARLSDLMTHRLFRALDEYELIFEGSLLDRLNRFEKRGIIRSAESWREIRELRNEISHEYLIEKKDNVVGRAYKKSRELLDALRAFREYFTKLPE